MTWSTSKASAFVLAAAVAACTSDRPKAVPATETIRIPAGAFIMGCAQPPLDDAIENPILVCQKDAMPARTVTLRAFEIDVTEVTQAQYAACVRASACSPPGAMVRYAPAEHPTHPVSGAAWQQAVGYCAYVGKRLPTEAEWEKAARGEDGGLYPWGDAPPDCERINFITCREPTDAHVEPVGSRPLDRSPYGVLDLAGSLSEWVADAYGADYYQVGATVDPPGPSVGADRRRVVRGEGPRASARSWRVAEMADSTIGFRCARDVK